MSFLVKNLSNIDNNESLELLAKKFIPFPNNAITMIVANGGMGKSFLALQMALKFVKETPNKKVFAFFSEDNFALIKERAELINSKILKANALNSEEMKNIFVASSNTEVPIFFKDNVFDDKAFEEFTELLKSYDLLIFDPLIAFYNANENDNSQARVFMQKWANYATLQNKAIVFLHHSDKTGRGSRGASAFVDAARLVYELSKSESYKNSLKLSIIKDNYNVYKYYKTKNINVFPK
ncbi:helicase RepA family protein [Campylobacter upsaliensis]|uniref:helicase RepA family protein n=1 Tax=Campylobacter upsaliensis TaxID=28080 RepID=UPI00214A52AE|nr:helicase RepA family protein [Campylobacter upsaliensis]MCR2115806.1 helicase RepA family protein [Campylobacter upsaliensis]